MIRIGLALALAGMIGCDDADPPPDFECPYGSVPEYRDPMLLEELSRSTRSAWRPLAR